MGDRVLDDSLFAPKRNLTADCLNYFLNECRDSTEDVKFGEWNIDKTTILFESKHMYTILSYKPFRAGHLLVVPKDTSIVNFKDMKSPDVLADWGRHALYASQVLGAIVNKMPVVASVKNGPEAGQTVNHLHLHLLPYDENGGVENHSKLSPLTNDEMKVQARLFKQFVKNSNFSITTTTSEGGGGGDIARGIGGTTDADGATIVGGSTTGTEDVVKWLGVIKNSPMKGHIVGLAVDDGTNNFDSKLSSFWSEIRNKCEEEFQSNFSSSQVSIIPSTTVKNVIYIHLLPNKIENENKVYSFIYKWQQQDQQDQQEDH